MGGECVSNGGRWEVGTTPMQLTETGKRLFGVPELNIQQMHRDHVPAVPPSFHLLGASSITPNQGMVKLYPGAAPESVSPSNVQVFCVQGHPEFDQFIVDEIVKARSASGVMSQEVVQDVAQRREWRNDGIGVIGKTLWEILRASRA
ncbi:hypothetical protein GSI_10626 [Ganoderma sinense ZZ0214-1]|uniref:Glutamine amidotransferase domain-containing protein n=1 Tax=Ganoderma sinense ZZ0214-1 TaxID=1077348 RepID=A0A2G8S130_9APHY|nr:hypothetical protein GSI_10626 [Ganoderma sinense ZZ0214-1]